jgi:hypothetical protein
MSLNKNIEELEDMLFDADMTEWYEAVKQLKQWYEAVKQLKQENEKLRDCVENLINATEYGVNQWQEAWLPSEETNAQKAIRVARKTLKELEHNA